MLQLAPAIAVGLVTALVGFATLHAPPATGEMGVVFAPWVDQQQVVGAIVAAGGRVADSSRFPNVMIAYAPDEGFQSRARRARGSRSRHRGYAHRPHRRGRGLQ